MAPNNAILQSVWIFSILLNTKADFSADEVYSKLSDKIDLMQNEMSELRSSLKLTKSELATAKAEQESTQTELENLKNGCRLDEQSKTVTVNPDIETGNTTIIRPKEKSCCEIMEHALMRIKVHHKQTTKDIGNMIEHKFDDLKKEIENNTQRLQSLDDDLKKLDDSFIDLRNNSDTKLEKMEQEAKFLIEEVTNRSNADQARRTQEMAKVGANVDALSKSFTNLTLHTANEFRSIDSKISKNKYDQVNLNRKLDKASADFRTLSTKHEKITEEMKKLDSNLLNRIRYELENAERCQSGSYTHRGRFPYSTTIYFGRSYSRTPSFMVGSSLLEFSAWTHLRIQYFVDDVSRSYATVRMNVWAETVAFGAGFHWMACPRS